MSRLNQCHTSNRYCTLVERPTVQHCAPKNKDYSMQLLGQNQTVESTLVHSPNAAAFLNASLARRKCLPSQRIIGTIVEVRRRIRLSHFLRRATGGCARQMAFLRDITDQICRVLRSLTLYNHPCTLSYILNVRFKSQRVVNKHSLNAP